MAARVLEAQYLAKLAGLSEDTVGRVRRGEAVDRSTLLRILAALDKAPANSMFAPLVAR